MLLDPRIIILFGANALLLFLTMMVNSSLAGASLYFLLLGPMIVLPALYLSLRSFFVCTLLSGLWIDAALPATFGLFTCGFLISGTLIIWSRLRYRAEHNFHPILIAHGANLFFILLLTLSEGLSHLSNPTFWIQVLITTLISHTALLVIAPWFFNLERLLFQLSHVETEPTDFPIL